MDAAVDEAAQTTSDTAAALADLPTGDARRDAPPADDRRRRRVDGVELAGLHVDETPTPDIDEQWLRRPDWRPALTDFSLGSESYAGQAMTLWFDDVALDRPRIGCQPVNGPMAF